MGIWEIGIEKEKEAERVFLPKRIQKGPNAIKKRKVSGVKEGILRSILMFRQRLEGLW